MKFRNLSLLLLGLSLSSGANAVSSYYPVIGDMPVLAYDTSITYRVAQINGGKAKYDRTISLLIKIPLARALDDGLVDKTLPAEEAPIVIYSHGSAAGDANGHTNPDNQHWTNELVSRGYITINIAHTPTLSTKELIASCYKVGISNSRAFRLSYAGSAHPSNTSLPETPGYVLDTSGDCAYFKSTMYLRYRDVMAVLNRLYTTLATDAPEMTALWDGNLALMGHSSGTGPVMSLAGATRSFLSSKNTYTTPDQTLFDAYVALSPQSDSAEPHIDGYAAKAWVNIEQPILMITGEEDTTGNQPAEGRKVPFNTMPDDPLSDDKFLVWFEGAASGHREMNLNSPTGTKATYIEQQAQHDVAIKTVVRFLDIYARKDTGLVLDENHVTENGKYKPVLFYSK